MCPPRTRAPPPAAAEPPGRRAASWSMNDRYFIPADAHEGCVWVAAQRRLYFTTTRKEAPPRVSLQYLDFSDVDLNAIAQGSDAAQLERLEPQIWMEETNVANSLCLSRDGKALLLAQQGDEKTPSRLVRIGLEDQATNVLFEAYRGTPLNSLNKVIESHHGHVIVSDPDYGFRQGFRPVPELEPRLYVLPRAGEPFAFDCGLEMPHGIALSTDERFLFVTDTSNDGAHPDGVELDRRCSVHRYEFAAETGRITGEGKHLFSVDKGVPDGSFTTPDALLVGGGDGVYVADARGELRGKIPLERTAVNLCVVGDHLFVTADEGVYFIPNWQDKVS